jgi:hypothetical protein
MQRHRLIAGIYAGILLGVTVLGWIPTFADENGRLFGIFRLTWYNDVLHLSSAAWAFGACITSTAASIIFLRVFGALYLIDGLMGLATGSGYLDLGIIIYGFRDLPMSFRVLANLPHIGLGAIALIAGLVGPEHRTSRMTP